MNALELRFAQILSERLGKDMANVSLNLANGSQINREDAAASGMNCARLVGKIEGLKLAIQRIDDVDHDIHGRKSEKPERAEA